MDDIRWPEGMERRCWRVLWLPSLRAGEEIEDGERVRVRRWGDHASGK